MFRTHAALFAAAVAVTPFVAASYQSGPPQRTGEGEVSAQPAIVLISPDDSSRPWVQRLTEGFREVALAGPNPPVIYQESLDTARFAEPDYLEEFRDWLGRKYRTRGVDLVVSLGEEGVDFLASKRGEPWPGVPVVYGEVGSMEVETATRLPDTTGLLLEDHFPAALAVIKQILPETNRVALIYGASAMERNRVRYFAEKVRTANLGLAPMEITGMSLSEILSTVAGLPRDAVVFMVSPATDATGRALAPSEACQRIAAAANRPAFMMALHDVGCGVVGGLVRDMKVFGGLIAEKALARLHDESKETVTLPIARYTRLVFDGRQLQRWAIAEASLPAGSTVLFRQPSLWRDHKSTMIAVAAVVLTQAVLIAGLVLEYRRRRHAEGEARRHLVSMAHLDRRHAMGELTASLAHELSQPLTAILRNAETAKMLLARSPFPSDDLQEIVEDIRKDDKRAGEVIRRLRALLCHHELEHVDLDVNEVAQEAVAIVAPDADERGVQVDLDLTAAPGIVGGDRVHLQQVLLNLMLNSIEAMSPMPPERRRLLVRTASHNGSVSVLVNDTGPGLGQDAPSRIFEAFYTTKGGGMGMGLSIARSIVEAHGGAIEAGNNAEGGATVRFTLPAQHAS